MDKELIREIIADVKPENGASAGYNCYDTWCNPEWSNKYHQLKYHITDKGYNSLYFEGELFIVNHRLARESRGGMDTGSPDTIEVRCLSTYVV